MAEHSKIEWCDHTFNPWIGCTKVSPGCDGCYAERSGPARVLRSRGRETWGPDGARYLTGTWGDPARWNKRHDAFFAEHGRRQRVFCASLADVFDNQVPSEWRADLFRLIANTPHLDWLLLTKRIGNAASMLDDAMLSLTYGSFAWNQESALRNVWIGATVVDQAEADRDIPKLLAVPARVRFLSIEPMLGPVDLARWLGRCCHGSVPGPGGVGGVTCGECGGIGHGCTRLHWVICGGESGPKARPMHPDWARGLRDQCAAAGVSFMFKQWGEHDLSYDRDRDDPDYRRCDRIGRLPGRWINLAGGHGFNGERVHYAHKVGKARAGRLLDGRAHDDMPEVA